MKYRVLHWIVLLICRNSYYLHLRTTPTKSTTYCHLCFRKKQNLISGIAYKVISTGSGFGTWGVTGLVVQVVDNVNDLNSYSRPSVRAKLAVKPLKKAQLVIPDDSYGDPNIYAAYGEDISPTASTQLVDITSNKQFFYPNDVRHRYAYLLNVTAPVTHSA